MTEHNAAKSVTISLNVSYTLQITPEELVQLFRGEIDWQPWRILLDVFFNELSATMIKKFMSENNISIEQLSSIYSAMPEIYQGHQFEEIRNEILGKISIHAKQKVKSPIRDITAL
jgi:hypothetical protein